MRTIAPSLLPILRSQVQAEILTALLLHPTREFTLSELAMLAKAPLTTIRREIDRLAEVGLVSEHQVGRSRIITTNTDHPYTRPLTELISHSFGPLAVIAEEFAALDGMSAVAIYGSWAERYSGAAGPSPGDVDVLVIGEAQRTAIYDAAEQAEHRLYRTPVNPVACSTKRWQAESDALIQSIKSKPIVWAIGTDPVGRETA